MSKQFPHYEMVPKSLDANLAWRKDLLEMAGKDPAVAKTLWKMCSEDLLFYVNFACFTYDPKTNPRIPKVPFITYGFQDEALEIIQNCIMDGEDFAMPKSREMGASWMGVLVFEWFWHFQPNLSFLFISRTANYVDDSGNPKSLFWKALTLDTDILTPGGWKKNKDIALGDSVIGEDGKPKRVVSIQDHGKKPVFRIEFKDGSFVRCCGDHLWPVTTSLNRSLVSQKIRSHAPVLIKTTSEMFRDFKYVASLRKAHRVSKKKTCNNYQIELCKPVEFEKAEALPMSPYVLGALLGDGCLSKSAIEISGIDNQVFDRISKELHGGVSLTKTGKCSYIFSRKIGSDAKNPVGEIIKSLGLRGKRSWEKFIPRKYLLASIQDRIDLLRGLMDTDGWVQLKEGKRGSRSYTFFETTSKMLADDLIFLIRSLGGMAHEARSYPRFYSYKGKRKKGRTAYRFGFGLNINPFSLDRKASAHRPREHLGKVIVDIRKDGEEAVRCLSVDSNSHLFVVQGFSLTHNCDFLHKNQPRWLLPTYRWMGSKDPNRRLMHLGNMDNGSVIDGESTTGEAGRGDRRTAMFIDEHAAFDISDGFRVLRATRDTTNCRGFNSTPQGANNAFYEVVHKTSAKIIRLHWSEHPVKSEGMYTTDATTGRVKLLDDWKGAVQLRAKGHKRREVVMYPDMYPFILDGRVRSPWYDVQCARCATIQEIGQELDIDFLGSDYQFFDPETIKILKEKHCRVPMLTGDLEFDPDTCKPKRFTENPKGNMDLWLMLDADGRIPGDRSFAIGADVSAGTGASNSVVSVVDRTTGEKVGVWRDSNTRPNPFAKLTVAMAEFFNRAYLCWDASGPTGETFTKRVIALGYGNVYYRRREKKVGRDLTDEPGYYLNPTAKTSLFEDYREALADHKYINRSERGMDECLQFIRKQDGTIEHSAAINTQDPSGARTAHGDEVVADALAALCMMDQERVGKPDKPEIPVGCLAWRREQKRLKMAVTDGLGEGW